MIRWTDYMKYRLQIREFDREKIEEIFANPQEQYYDTATLRNVIVSTIDRQLVLIPYEKEKDTVIPVTIHAITRKQIDFRIKTGRFVYE